MRSAIVGGLCLTLIAAALAGCNQELSRTDRFTVRPTGTKFGDSYWLSGTVHYVGFHPGNGPRQAPSGYVLAVDGQPKPFYIRYRGSMNSACLGGFIGKRVMLRGLMSEQRLDMGPDTPAYPASVIDVLEIYIDAARRMGK